MPVIYRSSPKRGGLLYSQSVTTSLGPRPWSEMESRSANEAREKLKKWHEFLAGDFVAGEFNLVQVCEKPDQWQIGVSMDWLKGKELPEPLDVYFLVQQLDQY